jgi:signal transduction histidine kinase/DNA-binding response OmpR family regulator
MPSQVEVDPNSPIPLITVALAVLVAIRTLVDYVRERDPMRLETALFFLVAAVGLRLFLELEPPRLQTVGYMLFAATPLLLLRLVQYFRHVPRWLQALAGAGLLGTWVIFLMTQPRTPPAHLLLGVYLVAYFVLLQAYVAQAFVRGAFASGGVTRRRLVSAAAGTLLVGSAVVAEGLRIVIVGMTVTPVAWTELLYVILVLAGVCYYAAFATPGWLRWSWQLEELHRFLRQGQGRSIDDRARETIDSLCTAAVAAAGGLIAVSALWDEGAQQFILGSALHSSGLPGRVAAGDGLLGRAWRERKAVVARTLVELSPAEERLASAICARGLLAVPIATQERAFGLLVLFYAQRPVFPADDAAVLTLLADQSALALANAELLGEQRQLNEQLRRANTDLERASRHKSEFLASMSHELRTPLNAIIGFSEVLVEGMFGELNAKQAEYLADVLESGRHLLSLINDVMDLSKVEAGRMELELGPCAMAEIVDNGLTMVRERASRHRIALHSVVEADVGEIEADARKVKQVLFNLLSNAVKFTPDGGRVEVVAHIEDGEVQVAVRDSGIGIAPEDHERIFEEFQQARASSSTAQEGSGLGLALAKRFVELHGGRIWLESRVGVGSTFTFTLPLRRPAVATETVAREQPAAPEPALGRGGGSSVLVIEDDPHALGLLQMYLQDEGFSVAVAHDGQQGLALARRLQPAAITLDVLLPGVDGWDFLVQARADPDLASIPIIVVSIVDERGKGFALGATDYLVKPAKREELLATLHRCCRSPKSLPTAATILAIDDDPMALELIAAILEPEGYTVLKATDGREGLELARRAQPALVILDLLMPDVDGFEVLDGLRGEPTTAGVPIVILTSRTMSAAEKARLNGRITHLAHKAEFRREAFLALVRELC